CVCSPSPRSSVARRVFLLAKATLSNEAWSGSPTKTTEIFPSLPLAEKSTRNTDPQAPRATKAGDAPIVASVSPVGTKNTVRKFEPGRKARFSGRLNGVAPAALASALASKLGQLGAQAVESCTFTHFTGQLVPRVCNFSWA